MAERRMFAKTIIDSDAFLEMPVTSQLLYFHLSMRADDDGFVNKPKSIVRMCNCKEKDLLMLADKKFIIPFKSGIVVIKHWKIHNYIRKDTYSETKYKDEKNALETDENNAYKMAFNCSVTKPSRNCDETLTQDRLGEDSIGKNNILSTSDNADKSYKAVNFQNIANSYNLICVSLPKVQRLTEARKKAIKSAVEFIGSEEDFENFFKKVEASDFLCGRTEKAWTGCGFDWIMKKNNIVKILEGNYSKQNKGKNNKPDYYDTSRYEDLNFN